VTSLKACRDCHSNIVTVVHQRGVGTQAGVRLAHAASGRRHTAGASVARSVWRRSVQVSGKATASQLPRRSECGRPMCREVGDELTSLVLHIAARGSLHYPVLCCVAVGCHVGCMPHHLAWQVARLSSHTESSTGVASPLGRACSVMRRTRRGDFSVGIVCVRISLVLQPLATAFHPSWDAFSVHIRLVQLEVV
jgi:hypothetical protein